MKVKKEYSQKQTKSTRQKKTFDTFFIGAPLIIVFITTIIYSKSLNNQFLEKWDDNIYVTENNNIGMLHEKNFLKQTFTSYIHGNYHPLTMLSLSLDYQKYKIEPYGYHKTNLTLHVLNSLLLFCFIWLLTKQKWVSLITSILFSTHPMHVESVAWISERKDVLFSFFYLAALCTYVLYKQKEQRKGLYYILTLIFFLFSTLSKGMAVTFPIVLFLIDYLMGQKITFKSVIEKIPLLIIALLFGVIAIQAQQESNAITLNYSTIERILFASYSVSLYLLKLIVPINLSSYYIYPKQVNGAYNIFVYLAPFIIFSLFILIYFSKKYSRDFIFGFGFFFITMSIVIQIIPVGEAIIAERYTYIPYIGLFFIIAKLINSQIENPGFIKTFSITSIIVFILICCYQTNKRTRDWKNDITLWTSAIESNKNCDMCYKNRADVYERRKQYNEAIKDFSVAINLNSKFSGAYNNRGLCYAKSGNYNVALKDFKMAILTNSKNIQAYNNLGNTFFSLNKYEDAIKAYTTTIQLNPQYSAAYNNRSLAYFNNKQYNLAYADAIKAKELRYAIEPGYIEKLILLLNTTKIK